MTGSSIIAIILAFLKALPALDKWADRLMIGVLQQRIGKITNRADDKTKKKLMIHKKIEEAASHEEKRLLFSTLNDVDRGWL